MKFHTQGVLHMKVPKMLHLPDPEPMPSQFALRIIDYHH
jgi:hypothetical protein